MLNASCAASAVPGVAEGGRLHSALRHVQRSVAMAVCTALHHSSNRNKKKEVEEEQLYNVPRHQQTQTVAGVPRPTGSGYG